MLQPKRTKYRKQQKGRNRGLAHRGSSVSFGEFGLKAVGRGRITARQIEAARRAMTRHIKRGGKIWIRIFPDKPITKKPLEVRQGKGKGSVEYWVAQIQPGKMLYEMEGVSEEVAREAFELAAAKLPIATKLLEELVNLRREQFNLRMQQATGQMARPDQYRKVRKNIARVKTVLRAQEIAEQPKAEAAKQESAS